ncbi:MAG: hypothetical protein NXI04_30070, partial [Planctomycetaceae bacterium]|nr:hypothetical protein [Planctomycetaceae bacterium]
IMGIEVLGFAVMSNHFHIILRNRPDVVDSWSNEEVARRWWQLCPARRDENGSPVAATKQEIELLANDESRLEEWRSRLSSVSWFMRFACEWIARRANKEEEVTGRFWEGRFKCQPLLDDAAILACMQYVDLNPIRAAIAKTIESSDFTSAQARARDLKEAARREDPNKADAVCEHGPNAGWLAPVSLEPRRKRVRMRKPKRRVSNNGILSMHLPEYLRLLDWTGRQLRRDGKHGAIPGELAPILDHLGVSPAVWVDSIKRFNRWNSQAIGRTSSIRQYADKLGKTRPGKLPTRGQLFA